MEKPFEITFDVDAKALAILYVCWRYKLPAAYMLSFYEMYGAQALFILKAISCTINKKIPINDNVLIKVIEESRELHKQILSGITTNIKRRNLSSLVKYGKHIPEPIPDEPTLDYTKFSDDYKEFIVDYLLQNVKNLFKEEITLSLNTKDLYEELGV